MKTFVAALLTLTATVCFCFFGTATGTKTVDAMLGVLSEIEAQSEKVPQNADEVCERLSVMWEEHSFLISMLLPHHHLDEVKEKLVTLTAYADTDEFAEWQDAKMVLEEELQHVRELMKFSADNVL